MAVTELFYKGNLLTDSVNICGAFNDHFANAGKNVQQSIGQLPPLDDTLRYVKQVNSYFKFSQVTEGQLCKIVNNLKPKHSSGNDGISNLLLKQLMPVIKGPLCLVLNHSLVVGVFPDYNVPKFYPSIKQAKQQILIITDQFHYYLSYQRY